MHILLFDDLPANRDEVKKAISQVLTNGDTLKEFTPLVGGLKDGTYESRLEKDLTTPPNDHVNLIVADRDLSAYTDSYPGLSESTVRRVADALGIPECGYARGENESTFISEGRQREACIRLRLNPTSEFATRVKAVAKGFMEIADKLPALTKDKRLPPGKLLAEILGKPEYAEKISLYASGDQNRWASVMQAHKGKENQIQRVACIMGYWA